MIVFKIFRPPLYERTDILTVRRARDWIKKNLTSAGLEPLSITQTDSMITVWYEDHGLNVGDDRKEAMK